MSNSYDYTSNNGILFSENTHISEPEDCLGFHFNSAEERREYFRNILREKLKDPDFRAIEGFPIGEDEDIIALSDPPYYCACPNPWIPDFIKEWESQKKPTTEPYKREPFAADVSEGKNHPIYTAHSYHTKVPHKAIMRYILHYTVPGDIILDCFCGTGMTGVAAQACGDRKAVEDLGFTVDSNNNVFSIDNINKKTTCISKLGVRKSIQNDLSPAASFIAYNYNTTINYSDFKHTANEILDDITRNYLWMYSTRHSDGTPCIINYVIWSDVFVCPHCGHEIVYYDVAVDEDGSIHDEFCCPNCSSNLTKKTIEKYISTHFDPELKENVHQVKQVPVVINYTFNNKRISKKPDSDDFKTLEKIDELPIPYWVPSERMMFGRETRRNDSSGLTHVHHYHTRRALFILSAFVSRCRALNTSKLLWLITSVLDGSSKMNRERPNGLPSKLTGTLYVSSLNREINVVEFIRRKIDKYYTRGISQSIIATHSSTLLNVPSNSVDYIFLDPPFGANLNYSELSFIWEAWLKVKTDNKEEAIENPSQGKGLFEYRRLMKSCFSEAFRVLKMGHWMTVEFSNTDSAVWNAIQTSLSEVGFVIANVSALDKQQGSFKAVTTSTAVKQDLILSLYKPDDSFEQQITSSVGIEAVWTFVRKHLEYLPLVKEQGETTITVPERDPRIIYDRMVSYFVGHNMYIPISSPDFLAEMPKRFAERNGLYYLPDQVQKYDKLVASQKLKEIDNETALFVCDENSAIAWIRVQLKEKPMTLGEMTPMFMTELSNWTKGEKKPELRELLEQNFLCHNGSDDVPSQIHSYLSTNYKELRNLDKDNQQLKDKAKGRWYIPDPNKASDLEKIREKALLREFSLYLESRGKIKEFRIEAIRTGFKKAWQEKNYALIKSICERLPTNIVEEDDKLLMWYSNSLTRLGE